MTGPAEGAPERPDFDGDDIAAAESAWDRLPAGPYAQALGGEDA